MNIDLHLQHLPHPVHRPVAALLPQAEVGQWLRELGRWPGDPLHLKLYLVPTSRQDLTPAGLLVISPDGQVPEELGCAQLYGRVGERLYVPIDAALHPAVSADELESLLSYDVQLLHPSIGLVAFDVEDALSIVALVEPLERRTSSWHAAHPGLPDTPLLRAVEAESQAVEEMLKAGSQGIGNQSLEELPPTPDEKGSGITDKLRGLESGMLKKFRSFLSDSPDKGKDKPQTPGQAGSRAGAAGDSGGGSGPGMAGRLSAWMDQRIEKLDQMRQKELSRLLGMLDKNPNEGLRYAIPLHGPHAHRGIAQPGGRLGRHGLDLNIGGLGGGSAVDSWSMGDDMYSQLYQRYTQAANQALAGGDHRRAAYVFAHLLGDYRAAANALEQGKFYREAAVIYQEHLNMQESAAECLEKGGLLTEAIELYIDLERFQKAGDLYARIERPDKAEACYRKAAEHALETRRDYLGAATIYEEKMKAPLEALRVLRQGWPHSPQASRCLRAEFGQHGRLGNHHDAAARLESLLETPMPDRDAMALVDVLCTLNTRYPEGTFRGSCGDAATVLIGQRIDGINSPGQAGRLLERLKDLTPGDMLLKRDCNRYLNQLSQPKPKTPAPEEPLSGIVRAPQDRFQLEGMSICTDAQPCQRGYLATGRQGQRVTLVRGDWHTSESHEWSFADGIVSGASMTVDEKTGKWALLIPSQGKPLRVETFGENDTFGTLQAGTPDWLPEQTLAAAIADNNRIVALHLGPDGFALTDYSSMGELLSTQPCEILESAALRGTPRMQVRRGDTYIAWGDQLWRISSDGTCHSLELPGTALQLQVSGLFSTVRLAVVTDHGCVITWPEVKGIGMNHDHFATDMPVTALAFLPGGHLVAAGHDQARLYSTRNQHLQYASDIHCEGRIVGVVPLGTANDFALFNAAGMVATYRNA